MNIATQGRPYSGGLFIKEMLHNIFKEFNYDYQFIKSLSLTRFSVVRHIDHIALDVENYIHEKLKHCEYFSFNLDESCDINDLSQLIICIRCVDKNYNVSETMFSLETFN